MTFNNKNEIEKRFVHYNRENFSKLYWWKAYEKKNYEKLYNENTRDKILEEDLTSEYCNEEDTHKF